MHRGLERLLIRLSNYITSSADSQNLFGKESVGSGEWGVGSEDKVCLPIPTPHSPFPTPFQLYLNHLASSGSVGRLPYISTPTR
jgi:hypothetical protein